MLRRYSGIKYPVKCCCQEDMMKTKDLLTRHALLFSSPANPSMTVRQYWTYVIEAETLLKLAERPS